MRLPDQTGTCAHEAATLLPWFVNGTLTAEERQAVEDHLAVCAVCPDEFVALLQVQSALRRELANAPEPSSALWEKVERQIVKASAVTDRLAPRTGGWQNRSTWSWLGNLWGPALRPGWAPAALLLIVAQAALIIGLLAKGPLQTSPEYHTLTGPSSLVPERSYRESEQPAGPRVRLRVAFVEQAPERAIRATLSRVKATIVDGPSAAGYYVIDVSLDGDLKTPPDAAQALRGRSDAIRFAELFSQ